MNINLEMCACDIPALMLCSSKDVTRYCLNGIFVERNDNNGYVAAATDGHRLAQITREPCESISCNFEKGIIIKPSKELITACKKKEAHTVVFDFKTKVASLLNKGRETLGCFLFKEIDGTYPEYREVMPKASEKFSSPQVAFNAGYVNDFGTISKLLTGKKNLPVVFVFNGSGVNPIDVKLEGAPYFSGVLMPMKSKEYC